MRSIFIFTSFLVLFYGCNKDNRKKFLLSDLYSNKAVGASANDLLASDKYKALKIEIHYMPGFAPDAAALTHLENLLSNSLNKPNGIEIIQKQIASGKKNQYGIYDIKEIEKDNRTVFTVGETIGVYFLICDAGYEAGNVLGIAYRNTSCVLFGKTIHDNSGGIGQASVTKVEATVMEHELGHLLGLVNIGTSMQAPHQDSDHGNHCTNTSCLMYYSAETTDMLGFLITGSIPDFDANCKADLQGNGGK